jgi:hypothetical protein
MEQQAGRYSLIAIHILIPYKFIVCYSLLYLVVIRIHNETDSFLLKATKPSVLGYLSSVSRAKEVKSVKMSLEYP